MLVLTLPVVTKARTLWNLLRQGHGMRHLVLALLYGAFDLGMSVTSK